MRARAGRHQRPPYYRTIGTHGRLCEPLLGICYILEGPTNELILIVGNAAICKEYGIQRHLCRG